MTGRGRPRLGIADVAFEAAGGDPVLALLLVLDLIWEGRLVVNRSGYRLNERKLLAA